MSSKRSFFWHCLYLHISLSALGSKDRILSVSKTIRMSAIKYYLRTMQILDIFFQLSSLSNRFGCRSELRNKHPNAKGQSFSCKYFKTSKWPFAAAYQHAHASIGHPFSTQYLTMARFPRIAAALIVCEPQSQFFTSRAQNEIFEFVHFSDSWAVWQHNISSCYYSFYC